MNPYLLPKVNKRLAWRVPVAFFCGFMAAAVVATTLERVDTMNGYDWFAAVFLLAAFLWPTIRTIMHILRCREAIRISRTLVQKTEETLSLEQLNREIPVSNLSKRLDTLINKGYLQNVHLDFVKNAVILIAPNQRVEQNEIIAVECPNCGAKNQVTKGRIGRCVYCEQPLTLHIERKKG